ncbi:hypothetical protein DPMN_026532 [Dreissena polymorpha]|uniref:Uncharacterized protein n=1 Tax=Dreissena polymorpha TaxID=45954 RepID=A0A9D4LRB2_DREPO|nr:hypothetical protein DPMN_026532 [Dreissena polymorpha]
MDNMVWILTTRCGCGQHGMNMDNTVWIWTTRCGYGQYVLDLDNTVWIWTTGCGFLQHGDHVKFLYGNIIPFDYKIE